MERVVWAKGDFELIENSLELEPIFYFEDIHTGLISDVYDSFDDAIKAKDEGRLKFHQRNRGTL